MHDRSAPPPAAILHRGARFAIPATGLALGRTGDNDVLVADERASRHHASIRVQDGGYRLVDLGSRHGTTVNGEPVADDGRVLVSGDTIAIGDEVLRFLAGDETHVASEPTTAPVVQQVTLQGDRLRIGRDAANDLVLTDPNVSRFHAEIVRAGETTTVEDLGSRNGTRLDGVLIEGRVALTPPAEIGVGPYRLVFDGASVAARDDHGALRLRGRGITVAVKDKTILTDADFEVGPGELVALIGESGAGKSTLLKVLAGVSRPSSGAVTVNGEPLAARLTDVGYLPQDEIVHGLLTVREALGYAARLRLPGDATPADVDAAVERVLGELSLDRHADTRIERLSGGQRKRTGLAMELLGRPSLLFLDEPTTGMDPQLEAQMMQLFRDLADGGRGVALVTHATKSLRLCDRVVVMGRGGLMTFDGSPAAALEFFGAEDFDDLYRALLETPAQEWRDRFLAGRAPATEAGDVTAAEPDAARPRVPFLLQARVLAARYGRIVVRDRKNLMLLVGQAPILGLAGVGLFKSGVIDHPSDAIQLLYLAALVATWLGSIAAARELVKERSVFQRERAIGTSLGAYLTSKVLVLTAIVAAQMLLYSAVLFPFRSLDVSAGDYVLVIGLLMATGLAGVAMGLVVSAITQTEDQAMSVIPLALIPQLLFSGATMPIKEMAEPAHTFSNLVFDQWSLAALGNVAGMNERLASSPTAASRYGFDFFDVSAAAGFGLLGAFVAVFLATTVFLLWRQTRHLAL